MPEGNIIVVLHQPRNPRNIGTVARAMLNTGFHQLRLVDPIPFTPALIADIAHRPEPILARLMITPDLSQALADVRYVVGTTDRPHPGLPWRNDVRQWATETIQRAATSGPVALLFGAEGNGLRRAELSLCNEIIGLPMAPMYPTLNLAQAVLLTLYELHQARTQPLLSHPPAEPSATFADRANLVAAFESLIDATHFIKSGNGQALRQRLRALIARAELSTRNAAIVTALLREAVRRIIGNQQEPPTHS